MAQMMKQECDKDGTDSLQQQQQQQLQQQQQQLTNAIMSMGATGQTSAALMSAQAYQQVLQQHQQHQLQQQQQPQQQQLQTSVAGGNLTPQLQFFQAQSNSAGTPLSLPWVVPPYQMMVLPQGMSQSLFALQDNHILVAPMGDGSNGQQEDALIQTAEGLVRQARDAEKRPTNAGSPAQQRASAAAGDGHGGSVVHGGNMMTIGGGQVVGDGGVFNAHLANTTLESIVGRHRGQVEMAKPELPKPPKKPLTPYMLFSKAIWPQVKAANSHLSSVCEIGAVVGALWRDLDPNEKQRYNELFAKDKERYDQELRLYLSTTGLHASDLVKPKQKRKDIRDKAARPASTTTLNTPSQQLVHTLMSNTVQGIDPQRHQQQQQATGATSLQDWTGQVQQFANQQQQLLAQMGLAGQTLYANSDGSISVDSSGNIGGLVAFHPQSLQVVPGTSGPGTVAGTGGQILYSDQRRGGLAQTSLSKLDGLTGGHSDPSRSWPQSQSNLVIYQTSASSAASSADQQVKLEGQGTMKGKGDGGMLNGPVDHHQGLATTTQYYSIDQLGQVVKVEEDGGSSRRTQLETELIHLRSALSEKTTEVQGLSQKLEEAYRIIDQYKQQFSSSSSDPAVGGRAPTPALSDRPVTDGNATDGVATVATTTNNV